jgi:hypothetical protein
MKLHYTRSAIAAATDRVLAAAGTGAAGQMQENSTPQQRFALKTAGLHDARGSHLHLNRSRMSAPRPS